ncbi:MAG: sensor histidine kinase [Gammaproteobacteria bacterium]
MSAPAGTASASGTRPAPPESAASPVANPNREAKKKASDPFFSSTRRASRGEIRGERRRLAPSLILRSSTFRLALSYMALFGASVVILLAFIYWSTARYMSEQTDETIQAEVAGLNERYRLEGLPGLVTVIQQRLGRRPTGSSIYLLTDPAFEPIAGNLNRWPNTSPNEDGGRNFVFPQLGEDDSDARKPPALPFRLPGGFNLLVGRDMQELEAIQQLIVRTLSWGLAITAALGLVGGVTMSRTLLRRIDAVNNTSEEIMSGDLSRRIPTRGTDDDFDQLARNLNDMLDRIQNLMESVRQVSDNIAHDLKTPLTRLRNRLEELGQDPEHRGDARIEEAIAEADRLLSTFSALLRIARVESSQSKSTFVPVRLRGLLEDVVELYEPLSEDRLQTLEVSADRDCTVNGDRDLLFQAFANLIDNGIKYTPQGGDIRVSLQVASDGRPSVTVRDGGPGIPPQVREHVFKRFVRLEESRTTPGNGLGLSLVKAVADLHGASVELGGDTGGLEVRFTFSSQLTLMPVGQLNAPPRRLVQLPSAAGLSSDSPQGEPAAPAGGAYSAASREAGRTSSRA